VQPFGLYVEHGLGVERHALMVFEVLGETGFVGGLDGAESVSKSRVQGIGFECDKTARIPVPFFADRLVEEGGETGIGLQKPSPVRDAVGDAREVARLHGGEVLKNAAL